MVQASKQKDERVVQYFKSVFLVVLAHSVYVCECMRANVCVCVGDVYVYVRAHMIVLLSV